MKVTEMGFDQFFKVFNCTIFLFLGVGWHILQAVCVHLIFQCWGNQIHVEDKCFAAELFPDLTLFFITLEGEEVWHSPGCAQGSLLAGPRNDVGCKESSVTLIFSL